jgi:hypothetical protein
MKLSIAEVERRFSARANYQAVSFTIRDTLLRKAGYLSLGGRGFNAPGATEQDFMAMSLGLVCSSQAKDVVEGYERVRAFKLDRVFLEQEDGARKKEKEEKWFWEPDCPLEQVLLSCFKSCALNPQTFHLRELRVDHSTVAPKAQLSLVDHERGGPAVTHILMFKGLAAPASYPPKAPEAVETSLRLPEHALMAMVELYALAIQLPAANDTGPSARTDEPGHSMEAKNVQTPTDRRRASTRKRRLGNEKL